MVPQLDFLRQPSDEEAAAGAFLGAALVDDSIESLEVAVAWARFGALARLQDRLEEFRERGGRSSLIVGIDEGGATRPGLLKALELFDDVWVFHDPSGRTFHPKIYLVEGPEKARLLVGSSNLTPGGLYFNYEASLSAEFTFPGEASEPALAGAREFLAELRDDSGICIALTEDSLEELANDPRYRIAATERRRSKTAAEEEPPKGAEDDEVDSIVEDAAGEGESLFGRSKHKKPAVPPLSDEAKAELRELEAEGDTRVEETLDDSEEGGATREPGAASSPAGTGAPGTTAPQAIPSWSKTLSRADAQQPTASGTNPTGVLRLAKAGHDINHRTWFRQQLFAGVQWAQDHDSHGNSIEVAVIPMATSVGGQNLGTLNVQIDHAPHREAGQNNVPTVLHWGETLGPLLRATDYTGHEVELQRLSDGSYRLDIS